MSLDGIVDNESNNIDNQNFNNTENHHLNNAENKGLGDKNPNKSNQELEFYKRGMEITSIYSVASFVDCYFTKLGLESGLYQESNPLVNTLIDELGTDLGLFTTKVIGLSLVLGCYYCLDKAKHNNEKIFNININPVYVPYTLSLLNSLGGTFSMIKNYFI